MKESNTKPTATLHAKEETAVRNLRSQKQKYEKALRESGAAAGREYVLEVGEDDGMYQQIVSLARREERASGSVAELAELLEALDFDRQDWLDQYGSEAEEEDWVRGFVEGALGKFAELHRKL